MTEPLWRLHDLRVVVPARAVSMLGDSVLSIVLLLYLQHAGIGVWPVAAILAVESLPLVVLVGIAGHVADTYDSKSILGLATAMQALACVALAFTHALVGVFLLFLVIQAGQAFAGPTWTALMPRVVGEDRIGHFAALQSGLAAVAVPVGAGLGGLLFGLTGPRTAILADAGTFALLLGAALLVQTRRRGAKTQGHGTPTASSSWTRLFAGFAVIRRDAIVWPMMWALAATIVVVGGVNVADVFLVRVSLHTSSTLYGLSEIVAAVGGAAGSVIAARFTAVASQVKVTFAGFAVVGLGCLGAGLSPDFAVYLCFACIVGLANTAVNATFAAVLIRRTPEADRGKAAASLNGLAQAGMVAALVLGGTAGQAFGPRATFVIAGLAGVAVAIGSAVLASRRAGARRPGQEEQPEVVV
ncbi:MAG: MFS transporter [Actinomycetota bacterium]|nr:MFS transporter [Actinomycetota bacterium]